MRSLANAGRRLINSTSACWKTVDTACTVFPTAGQELLAHEDSLFTKSNMGECATRLYIFGYTLITVR